MSIDEDLELYIANGMKNRPQGALTTIPQDNYAFTVYSNTSRNVLILKKDTLTICDVNGAPIVEIDLNNGSVDVKGDVNEAAQQFWKAVSQMYYTFVPR